MNARIIEAGTLVLGYIIMALAVYALRPYRSALDVATLWTWWNSLEARVTQWVGSHLVILMGMYGLYVLTRLAMAIEAIALAAHSNDSKER
jgi:hypothetical protein